MSLSHVFFSERHCPKFGWELVPSRAKIIVSPVKLSEVKHHTGHIFLQVTCLRKEGLTIQYVTTIYLLKCRKYITRFSSGKSNQTNSIYYICRNSSRSLNHWNIKINGCFSLVENLSSSVL